MKTRSVFLFVLLVTTALTILPCKAEPVAHIPKLACGGTMTPSETAPYMGGYLDTNGSNIGVNKTRVTVSFPDTDPSVIQTDNWLAGGMFATGYTDYRIGWLIFFIVFILPILILIFVALISAELEKPKVITTTRLHPYRLKKYPKGPLITKYQRRYPHNPEGVLEFHISRKMKEGKTREQAIEELEKEQA